MRRVVQAPMPGIIVNPFTLENGTSFAVSLVDIEQCSAALLTLTKMILVAYFD